MPTLNIPVDLGNIETTVWENSQISSAFLSDYQTIIQVNHARNAAGVLYVAQISNPNADVPSGQLDFIRMDDNDPPNALHTTSIETSGVTFVDFALTTANHIYMVYSQTDTAYFRESKDGGDTFSSRQQINTTTDIVSCCWDRHSGFLIVLDQILPTAHKEIYNGTIGDDGVTWSFTSPQDLQVRAALSPLFIRQTADGRLHYIDYNLGVNHWYSKDFRADTTSTWSNQSIMSDLSNVIWAETFCISPTDGMFVTAGYDLHASVWNIVVGTVNIGASNYTFSAKVPMTTLVYFTYGSLGRRKDGTFEIAAYDVNGNFKFLTCKALKSDGTGVWS